LGDSDTLEVGQLTIAIGSPFGQEFTMTSGIISAVGRTIRSGNALFSIPKAIQTDASINPGNSGGPLLNREGAVIGINSQILSRTGVNNGIGFAVPINTAKQVVPTLMKGETYEYAWLGISGGTLTPEVVDLMDLPADTQGALVIDVTQDGPADKAGLSGSDKTLTEAGQEYQLGGDVITAINGQPVETMDDLISYLIEQTQPGDTVNLDVIRSDGQQETVSVTLGVRPSADELTQSSGAE
jgi:S1-C subfamily serine protease